jgi:UDP-N-acetylmuramate--alanine ligase
MDDVEQAFIDFVDRVPFYGMVLLCNDDHRLRSLLPRLARRAVTYGLRQDSDFRIALDHSGSTDSALNVGATARATTAGQNFAASFAVEYRGKSLGEFNLRVPGVHNILNATAAVAVGVGLDIDPARIREGLAEFRGVDRRFQLRGRAAGVSVIDDYGHHPTEIRATLSAARQCGFNRIHVVFQPHRYTRTRDLLRDFGSAFNDADNIVVLDIYAASEPPIPGVTGEIVAAAIQVSGKPARFAASFEEAAHQAASAAADGDMILTLGAGNVSQLGAQVLEHLRARENAKRVPA